MRIAIVAPYYPWPPSIGGVETIVRTTATELAKRGYEVHVITTPFDVVTIRQVSPYGKEEKDGVIIHKLKPGSIRIGYARLIHGLKETIIKINPDIVHEHNLHPHLFQLAKWKKELKYKLIAQLHYPVIELDFLIQKALKPVAELGLRHINKDVDKFIAHTNLERGWLLSLDVPQNKIEIIRFPWVGVSSSLFNCTDHNPVKDIIYLGRIVKRKGLHVLLHALYFVKQTYKDIKVTIAGPADPPYLSKLKTLVNKYDISANVSFTGPIAEDEKCAILATHKVFVQPSLKEYTTITIPEAQAVGLPVVATKVGAIPEIVEHGKTGILVNPNDEKELADAITLLLANEDLRQSLSNNAKREIVKFNFIKLIDRLEDLYKMFTS
jgi:glycosyltransferase involved in cell wall biosynthesis